MRFLKPLILGLATAIAPIAQANSPLQVMHHRGDMLGWEAVGRLDLPGGFCTGVLIGRDLVLTAAHCLFDRHSRARLDISQARFRAGYLNGSSLFERRIVDSAILENYSYSGPVMRASEAALDVALLRLDRAVTNSEAQPFLVHEGASQTRKVQIMSYGRGRAEAMSWQRECMALRENRELLEFDCDTTFGSSGAPVFTSEDGRIRIVSLVSGNWQTPEGENRVIGMKLSNVISKLRAQLGQFSTLQSPAPSGVKRLRVGQGTRSGSAKFLKP